LGFNFMGLMVGVGGRGLEGVGNFLSFRNCSKDMGLGLGAGLVMGFGFAVSIFGLDLGLDLGFTLGGVVTSFGLGATFRGGRGFLATTWGGLD